jgi:hypothetical protein
MVIQERSRDFEGNGTWGQWYQTFPITDSALRLNLTTAAQHVTDANAAVTNGWHRFDGAINTPPTITNNQGYIFVENWGANYLVQTLHVLGTDEIWTRRCEAGAWATWVKTYPVADGALPIRIAAFTTQITDWNNAVQNGWYKGAGIPNQPVADGQWYMGEVVAHDSDWVTQRVWQFTLSRGSPVWERRKNGGAWQPWIQVTAEDRLAAVAVQRTDCNACVESGWYCLNAAVNGPAGVSNNQCYLQVITWQAGMYIKQVWRTLGGAEVYERDLSNGSWTAWTKTYPISAAPATQTRQYPLKLTAPRSQSFQGNAFWTVTSMPGFDFAHWEFVKDVEGRVSGQILIPKTIAAVPNIKIVLVLASPASGGVTRMNVAYAVVGFDNGYLAGTFTAVGAQDITSHVTAYGTRKATFAIPNLGSECMLAFEIIHEGAHANDTIAQNTWLVEAYLECES